jgi:hypothetical protein
VGNTITGAASGENANGASPKDSLSQAKGQKTAKDFVVLFRKKLRLEEFQSFFSCIGITDLIPCV